MNWKTLLTFSPQELRLHTSCTEYYSGVYNWNNYDYQVCMHADCSWSDLSWWTDNDQPDRQRQPVRGDSRYCQPLNRIPDSPSCLFFFKAPSVPQGGKPDPVFLLRKVMHGNVTCV